MHGGHVGEHCALPSAPCTYACLRQVHPGPHLAQLRHAPTSPLVPLGSPGPHHARRGDHLLGRRHVPQEPPARHHHLGERHTAPWVRHAHLPDV